MDCNFHPTKNDKSARNQSARKTSLLDSTSLTGATRLAMWGLAGALTLTIHSGAHALPTNGTVVAGTAGITSTTGTLTVNQSSQNAAINWQSFSIGTGQTVTFQQPNSNSVALNRVVGSDPSSILGSLSANGKVFLLNPNGVLFAKGAQVNVGGLVASTLGMTDANFMAGNYKLSGASNNAVVNQGTINANGGYVALLGASVDNEGVISARLGTVTLAAGRAITIDVAGNGLLNVVVDQGVVNALVKNGGLIRANGGQVVMTAQAAGLLLKTAVNNTGVIEAQSIGTRNGTIQLLADDQSGTVNAGGTLDVSGAGTGQTGGNVTLTGAHVGLFGAQINASGNAGGGTVLVGGDLHGTNAAVPNAAATYMSTDAKINADATATGNGGKVVLWANNSTRAYGTITARGGAQSGDGGVIETSGHALDVNGLSVNASATNGTDGMWLLDPADVTITSSTSGGTFSATTPTDVFSPNTGVGASNVNGATIVTDLNAGTNVTINSANTGGAGTGDITVAEALTWTGPAGTPTTLTLNAVRDVNVGAAVTATNGNFVAVAGRDVNVGAAVTVTNGDFTTTATNAVNVTAAVTTTGNYNAYAGTDVTVSAQITTTGVLTLLAGNNGLGLGTVIFTAPGTVALTGTANIYYNPTLYSAPTPYAATDFTGPGTVNAHMWVYAVGDNKVYDGTRAATVSLNDALPQGTPSVTLTTTNALFDTKDVGTGKTITFSSYSLSDPAFALFAPFGPLVGAGTTTGNITPAPLTVTADNVSKVYGTTLALPTTAFTSVGLVAGETIATVNEASPGIVATAAVAGNPYVLTPSSATGGTFAPTNYAITYVNGTLNVTPAPLTVTADNATKVYGQTLALATTAFTSAGLQNGDTIAGVTETSPGTAATASVAGSTYAITPSNAVGGTYVPTNYTVTYVNGALTVTPAPLVVTADNANKVYGHAITLAATAFTSAGLQNGDTIAGVTETSPGTVATAPVAGSPYAITPSNAVGGTYVPTNYITTYVNGALTVTPAVLTVTADNATKVNGQAITLPATAFTSAGLQNGDTIAGVTETSPGTVASAPVAGSPYPITPSNAVGGTYVPTNYTTTYVNGVLTVTPSPTGTTPSSSGTAPSGVPIGTVTQLNPIPNGPTFTVVDQGVMMPVFPPTVAPPPPPPPEEQVPPPITEPPPKHGRG